MALGDARRNIESVVDYAAGQQLQQAPAETSAGPFPLPDAARLGAVLAGAGGLSAGIFGWYVIVTHGARAGFVSDFLFLVLAAAGVAGAIAVWIAYAFFVSRWIGVSYESLLVADAYAYLPVLVLALYVLQVPLSIASPSLLLSLVVLAWMAIKVGVLAYFVRSVRMVVGVFLATRIPLILISSLAAIVIGQRAGHHWSPGRGIVLDVWGRWDAQHYLDIAVQGYHGKDFAFFPLYPALIHVFGGLIGDHLIAALIISNLAFLVALAYLYALVKLEFGEDTTAFHAVFYIAVFPTAIFFSAAYTESLFLALTVASVYYARHGNFITSGVFGALASMTRFHGVLLVLPLAYEIWRAYRERRGTVLARGIIGLALVPSGLAAYMAYLYALVGDPWYFLKVQANWNRHLAAPWVSIGNALKQIAHSASAAASANHVIELAFTVAFLVLLVIAIRTLRPSYWLYFAASMLIPMSTASLMSIPRFDLVVFPAFMLLALWGRRPLVNSAILALFLPLLGLFTVFFADWYWLA
jgi:Gpi18-like mannosyltransferase